MKTTIPALQSWIRLASAEEQRQLAEAIGTSRAMLSHYANGHRRPSAERGILIERETARMHRSTKGRLPKLYRTDLVSACRACEYAEKCLGSRIVASAEFMSIRDASELETQDAA